MSPLYDYKDTHIVSDDSGRKKIDGRGGEMLMRLCVLQVFPRQLRAMRRSTNVRPDGRRARATRRARDS